MTILKNGPTNTRISKTICYLSQDSQNDFDPQFNLPIRGSIIPKFILYFRSHANILTKSTWEKLGRLPLINSDYYLKLDDQGLIDPLGLCKNV